MKRTILLSLLLTLVLTMAKAYDEVAGFNGPTWYAYTENISEGNGSKSDPYLIKTAGQLAMLALEVNNGDSKEGKYYTIAADISLNKRAENLRVLWVPIGLDEDHPFSGTLTNPNGYSITGMMIDVSSVATTKYFGLFGYLKGTVDGIRIAGDSEIKLSDQGDYNAGLLCGYLDGGSYVKHCNIEDSYITGTKLDGSIYIGGLTGYNAQATGDGSENGRTYSCVVKTTISLEGNGSSSITAGGVIGRSYGKVLDCHAVVDMTATSFSTSNESYLGGIIGRVDGGNLKYCSASGDIRAGVGSHAITGGAFGYVNSLYANSGKYRINIDYCVTTVAISGGHTLGGFIGYCYVGGSLYVDFTSDFSSSYIDACNASYAGGFIGELEYSKRITDGDNIWLSQAGTGNGFIGTMKKPTTVNYGVILGHTTRVPDANLKVLPANQSRFYYNGDMCNYQIVGDNRTIEKIDNYGGHIPDGDGYGIYGIVYGNGASLQNPGPAALNNEEPDDRLEMCNTDNYKLCAMLFYITNDKKTLYKGTDVTVDFSIEDIMNSTTGERVCQFTVPEDVTCVKVVDKHIYPLDPGEVVVTVKWNGLQRKVHLDITYGKDWTGGRNEAFEGGDGTQENPYLIHNADQFYSAVGSKKYNKKDDSSISTAKTNSSSINKDNSSKDEEEDVFQKPRTRGGIKHKIGNFQPGRATISVPLSSFNGISHNASFQSKLLFFNGGKPRPKFQHIPYAHEKVPEDSKKKIPFSKTEKKIEKKVEKKNIEKEKEKEKDNDNIECNININQILESKSKITKNDNKNSNNINTTNKNKNSINIEKKEKKETEKEKEKEREIGKNFYYYVMELSFIGCLLDIYKYLNSNLIFKEAFVEKFGDNLTRFFVNQMVNAFRTFYQGNLIHYDKIEVLPHLMIRRAWSSMIFVPPKYIFIVSGTTTAVEIYDMEKKMINHDSDLNEKRGECTLCCINNSILYAFCGFAVGENYLSTIEKCNLRNEKRTWSLVNYSTNDECLFEQCYYACSFFSDNSIILFGASESEKNSFQNILFDTEDEAEDFFNSLGSYCDGVVMVKEAGKGAEPAGRYAEV